MHTRLAAFFYGGIKILYSGSSVPYELVPTIDNTRAAKKKKKKKTKNLMKKKREPSGCQS